MATKITMFLCPDCFVPVGYSRTERDYEYSEKMYKCPKCKNEYSERSCVEVEQ